MSKSPETGIKAASGVVSGILGAFLLCIGGLAIAFGHCAGDAGNWMTKSDNNGAGTVLGSAFDLGGTILLAVGVFVAIGGTVLIATALGFGASLFARKA